MARYGVSKYGLSTYGVGSETNLLWVVDIDWDGDGVFDGRNDATNMVDFESYRGRQRFIKADGSGFEPMQPGYAVLTLDNDSGDYDPYNTLSPLYPNVEPGAYAKVRVQNGEAGTPCSIIAGKIESIVPLDRGTKVQITLYDGKKQLDETQITTDLNQNIGTGAAIEDVLDRASYPAIWGTNIDAGMDTIPYWWEKSIAASTAIDRLWQSESGKAAVLANGSFRFYGRGASQASVLTIDQGKMLKDIQIPMPFDVIRNIVQVQVYPRIERSVGDLWTLRDKPLVKAGESIEMWGSYTYSNRSVAAVDIVAPVKTTDYTMNTQVDGLGVDKSDNFTVTATSFAESTKFVVLNGGADDAYITLLKIRGDAIDAPDSTYVQDDNSGTAVKRVFKLDVPWMQTIQKATDYATYLSSILGTNQKYPRFQMESQPDYQFGFDLLDKLTLTIGKYSISSGFGVGGIDHKWLSDTGQAVLTTVYTEPFVTQSREDGYWIFTATFPMKFPY